MRNRRYPTPAHTYYVDATAGVDTQSGAADKPIQTLAQVQALALKPGDRVLFKRGETWQAQSIDIPASGRWGRPICFGAYATGANPKLDPVSVFADFSLHSGVVWKRTDTGNDTWQVFEDGIRMTYRADVASLTAGSWCFVSGVLYVRCSDDGDPNTEHVIEYSLAANHFAVDFNGKSHLVFDHIDVTRSNYTSYCARVLGSVDILIQNCTVNWSASRSILIGTDASTNWTYPTDITIRNVIGHDDLDVPFWIGHGTRLIVEYCEAYNNGKDVTPGAKNYPTAIHFPNGICISAEAVDCIVRNNYIHDCYVGTALIDERSGGIKAERLIVEANKIDTAGTALRGINVEGTNTTIRNNWINVGTGAAILLANAPTVPLIYNNTLISASGATHSIDTASQPGAIIKNNIIVRAGSTNRYIAVAIAAQTGMAMGNNLYYGSSTNRWFWGPTEYTTLANWQAACSIDDNSLNVDPEFVTANTDPHLQATSDAIGAGATGLGVIYDYDGVPRGAAVDIGAFEYVA